MADIVQIKSIENITHDVLQIVTEKPFGLVFKTGQAADVSVNKNGWKNELRPFTFTSLPQHDFVEFIIKTYPTHNGVTNQLRSLVVGDELIIGDVFGDIQYKGDGVFIAGGAGITPFIAILKQLENESKIGNNKLIFANKTKADIILEGKLKSWLGANFISVLSDEKIDGYENGYITTDIIKNQIDEKQYLYLCGPPPMMEAVTKQLTDLGVSSEFIVQEAF